MARAFAIEGEFAAAAPISASPPSKGRDTRAAGGAAGAGARALDIGGVQRILGEQMEDVGQQQFLVLLFVMAAQLD